MKVRVKSAILIVIFVVNLISCISEGDPIPRSEIKTISGVAFKDDGTVFSQSAKISAVDTEGNTAISSVGVNGAFKVTLKADKQQNKNARLIDGNTFLEVNDGINKINLVIGFDQTNINFNAVTAATSQIIIKNSGVNFSTIFAAVEEVNKKNNKNEIIDQTVLNNLLLVRLFYKGEFEEIAQNLTGAIFGFDSDGKVTVDYKKIMKGSVNDKEVLLLKSAFNVLGIDIIQFAVNAFNNSNNSSFLLNDPNFFKDIGIELANETGKASNSAFSDFLNSVIKSNEILLLLESLSSELNAYVKAFENDINTNFNILIPSDLVKSAPSVIVSVSRSGDIVSYSVLGGSKGDKTTITLEVLASSVVKAIVTIPLTFDGIDLIAGSATVVLETKSVSIQVENTEALKFGSVDLTVALSEAKSSLLDARQSELASSVPDNLDGIKLILYSTSVVRENVENISTYLTSGDITVSSSVGMILE